MPGRFFLLVWLPSFVLAACPPVALAEETVNGRTAREWAGLLASKEVSERRQAAFSLVRFKASDLRPHVGPLAAALRDEDDLVRLAAASALGQLESEGLEAVPALVAALGDAQERVGKLAAAALVRMRPHSVAPLAKALSDKNPQARALAAAALAQIGVDAKSAVQPLAQVLAEDEYRAVQTNAAAALARIGAPAVPALIELLKHAREVVRMLAAGALGDMGPEARAALPALRKAGEDSSPDVREAAKEAIRNIESAPPQAP